MHTVFRYIKLYIEFTKQNLKAMMEYRTDFIIGAMSTFVSQLTGILFVWVVFQNIGNIKGWGFYEILLVYGFMALARSINHIFFDNLWVVGINYIKVGSFDRLLIRPISPLFHLIADKIQQDGVGNLVIGLIVVAKSVYELKLQLRPLDILFMFIFVVSGGIIFAAINLITATSSFWVVNSTPIIWSIFATHELAQYPLDIYRKFVGVALTWVIPYAFASFYPANYFLHRGYQGLAFLAPVIAAILWMVAIRVWNFGLRNYESTGS